MYGYARFTEFGDPINNVMELQKKGQTHTKWHWKGNKKEKYKFGKISKYIQARQTHSENVTTK